MADNFDITTGSGTTVATDDVGGVHFQKVKLMDPTADSSNAIATGQGDTTQGTIRVIHAGDAAVSVSVLSGTITTVTAVTGITNSVAATIVDSSGVAYSGSNPVPVDDLSVAMTTMPTAVADAGSVTFKSDKFGRSLTVPFQVRDLVKTARASVTTGTEATLLAATAGKKYDLVWLSASTDSTWPVSGPTSATLQGSVFIDIRMVTAGNIVTTLTLPPSDRGNLIFQPPYPYPQSDTGNNWTVDMNDITGTTATIDALFIENS